MFDLTYFYEGEELTVLKELPNTYKMPDAIDEVLGTTKTLVEAATLLHETGMWQWFQIYNLWNNNGQVSEMFAQPVYEDTLAELTSHFRDSFKADRSVAVSSIKVIVDGMEFDGDEMSRFRMTTAIAAAVDDADTTKWALADNSVADVTRVQLGQALRLSGIEMENIWFQE